VTCSKYTHPTINPSVCVCVHLCSSLCVALVFVQCVCLYVCRVCVCVDWRGVPCGVFLWCDGYLEYFVCFCAMTISVKFVVNASHAVPLCVRCVWAFCVCFVCVSHVFPVCVCLCARTLTFDTAGAKGKAHTDRSTSFLNSDPSLF